MPAMRASSWSSSGSGEVAETVKSMAETRLLGARVCFAGAASTTMDVLVMIETQRRLIAVQNVKGASADGGSILVKEGFKRKDDVDRRDGFGRWKTRFLAAVAAVEKRAFEGAVVLRGWMTFVKDEARNAWSIGSLNIVLCSLCLGG